MAKKKKTVYVCQQCGYDSPKWQGKCPECGSWNTFVEETFTKKPEAKGAAPVRGDSAVRFSQMKKTSAFFFSKIHSRSSSSEATTSSSIFS